MPSVCRCTCQVFSLTGLIQAGFGMLVGVLMSLPFREGINSASKFIASRIDERSASPAEQVRAAGREVKVTKYSWDDDGTYVNVTA